jgi:hypothetical protein
MTKKFNMPQFLGHPQDTIPAALRNDNTQLFIELSKYTEITSCGKKIHIPNVRFNKIIYVFNLVKETKPPT